jgi:DNA invertase Pin-like site-specific DNA recombinase
MEAQMQNRVRLKVVAYVRVSSEGQRDNFSISAQRREIERYCEAKGWVLEFCYVDDGISAWTEKLDKRPQFCRLLADMKNDKFDLIVVHTLDRWSRNLAVTLQTFQEMNDAKVAFASVSENIDYSTPEGRLFIAMLGAFAQYFSDSLAKHTRKGMSERAIKGYHLGGIPFGYVSCQCCEAGLHPEEGESDAVIQLFEKYATGTFVLADLAQWMNEEGYRTRNTKKLTDSQGNEVAGPRKFTIYSVRGLLHNPFFAGRVKHGKELHPGLHAPLVSQSLFDLVQQQLTKAKGQRHTSGGSYRKYLLKGLIRCVWCGLPVWGETLWHGQSYYRERKMTRSEGGCKNEGKTVRTELLDAQMAQVIQRIQLDPIWERRAAGLITTLDRQTQVQGDRDKIEQKLKRLGKVYVDGFLDDADYEFQRRVLKSQLDGLIVPEQGSILQAGRLLEDLPLMWDKAQLEERHTILRGFLECVYVDLAEPPTLVGIKPKPQFLEFLGRVGPEEMATDKIGNEGSDAENASEPILTGWWRRGREPVSKSCISRGFEQLK